MQHEITERRNVFENDGRVMCAGWARRPLLDYNRGRSKSRVDGRDCYFVNNGEVSLYLSVENLGHEFSVKIAVADLKRGGVIYDDVVKKFALSKNEVPDPEDAAEFFYSDKRLCLRLTETAYGKIIKCDFIDFGGIKNLYFNIRLKNLGGDSLSQIAPFERNRKYFYFKRFAPVFNANGVIRVGGTEYSLEEINALAYHDCTRFSKPRKHNYQRLSSDCFIGGKRFSLCLASRVGDNRYGNENCFFLDGKLEKLSQINVKGSGAKLDRPWYFSAGISAVNITFKPFTIKNEAMAAYTDKTTVIFGRLYGELKRINIENPIVLDNSLAHVVISEF